MTPLEAMDELHEMFMTVLEKGAATHGTGYFS